MFTMTNYGMTWFDNNPGQHPVLSQFRIGDAYGYTADMSQTSLQGGLLFTGIPSSPRLLPSGELAYDLFMDLSVGDFTWGEAGLFMNGNLFLVGAYSTPMRKTRLTGTQEGNFVSLSLVVTPGQSAVTVLINNTENELNVQRSGGIDTLPPAQLAYPNVVVVANPSAPNRALLAVAESMLWNVQGYDVSAYSGQIVSATANSVRLPSDIEGSAVAGDFLVQVLSGPAAGYIRVVSSWSPSSKTLTFHTALPVNPLPGDQILVSRFSRPETEVTYPDILDQLDPGLTGDDLNQLMDLDTFFAPLFRKDGSSVMQGNLQVGGNRVIGVASPLQNSDASNKGYVDGEISLHLAASDPHPQYALASGVQGIVQGQINTLVPPLISQALAAHEILGDPHPQYLTTTGVQFIVQSSMSDHTSAVDPHPQYTTTTESQTIAASLVADHVGLADPHPQYTSTARVSTLVAAGMSTHLQDLDPHPQYLTASQSAAAIQTALDSHVASADPHSQYRTEAQVSSAVTVALATHVADPDPHPQYTSQDEVDVRVAAALTSHLSAGDPHPQYSTSAEVNAAAQTIASSAASAALSDHLSAPNPHAQYVQADALNAAILADRISHESAPDPHPQYTTADEVTSLATSAASTAASAAVSGHLMAADPHTQYLNVDRLSPHLAAAVSDAADNTAAAIAAHKIEADPHPDYVSATELSTSLAAKEDSIAKSLGYAKWSAGGWVFVNETYLQSFTETDPVFSASAAGSIQPTDVSNWNTAFGWGNHATQGYAKAPALVTDGAVAVFNGTTGGALKEIPGFYWDPAYGATIRKVPGAVNNLNGFAVVAGAEEAVTTYWAAETDFGDGLITSAGAFSTVYPGNSETFLSTMATSTNGRIAASFSDFPSGLQQDAFFYVGEDSSYASVTSGDSSNLNSGLSLRAEDDRQQLEVLGPGVLDFKFPAGVLWKFGHQGQLAVGLSNNYGVAGQVLTSNGSASAVSWTSLGTAALAASSDFVPAAHTTDPDPHPQYTTAAEAAAAAPVQSVNGMTGAVTIPVYSPVFAAPASLSAGAAVVEGVATSLSRSDHVHALSAGVPVALGASASEGSSSSVARSDHVHPLPTVAELGLGNYVVGPATSTVGRLSAFNNASGNLLTVSPVATGTEGLSLVTDSPDERGFYVSLSGATNSTALLQTYENQSYGSTAEMKVSAASASLLSESYSRATPDYSFISQTTTDPDETLYSEIYTLTSASTTELAMTYQGPAANRELGLVVDGSSQQLYWDGGPTSALDFVAASGVKFSFGSNGQFGLGAARTYGTAGQVLSSGGPTAAAVWTTLGTAAFEATTAFTPASHVGSGAAAHALATPSTPGFMSAADKTKLDSIAGGGAGVSSVDVVSSVTGIVTSGGPVTSSGSITISYTAGYSIPTDTAQSNWNTAFGWGNHAAAGYLTSSLAASTYVPLAGGVTLTGHLSVPAGATGAQVPRAQDVEPVGTASAAVSAHVAAGDPHPQYTTVAEAAAAAPVQSVNGMTGAVTISGFAPAVHTHSITDVTGLQTALDSKVSGPASSVNEQLVVFNGTSGKSITAAGNLALSEYGLTYTSQAADVNGFDGFWTKLDSGISTSGYLYSTTIEYDPGVFTSASYMGVTHNASGIQSNTGGEATANYSGFGCSYQNATHNYNTLLNSSAGSTSLSLFGRIGGTLVSGLSLQLNGSAQELEVMGAGTLDFRFPSGVRFRLGAQGQLGLGAAGDSGSANQLLTSGGAGASPSWSSLKTINGSSLLGSGDLVISGSGSGFSQKRPHLWS